MGVRPVYMDHAATTAVRAEVLEAMLPFFTQTYGNASSVHAFGRAAKRALEQARRQTAAALGADPREVYFTAGGSESDNWALRCALRPEKGRHIITTRVEHHAVLHTCAYLETKGYEVTYLPVDGFGRVSPEDVRAAIRPDTVLVSVMAANNEVGTLEPIEAIGQITRERGILFHTDAVQAVGAIPVDVNAWNVDLLSLSGHKLHAPKGVGALYIRKGVRIGSFIHGGEQERGLRAGTENLPGIVGLGKAMELAHAELTEHARHVSALRDMLIEGLLHTVPDTDLNGHPTERLPGNANLSFRGVEGETLLMRLDLEGIAASSGSACTSGSTEPSHVLEAMGLPADRVRGSVRFSLGRDNTEADVRYVLDTLPRIVQELRKLTDIE